MNHIRPNGLPPDHVDRLMRSFFTYEMPHPWPLADVALTARRVQRSSWMRSGRLGLVASVAVIVFSYLALAAWFPAEPSHGLNVDRHQTIGSKPGMKKQ